MAPDNLFPTLPDVARCWIYAAERPLTEAQQQNLLEHLDGFFSGWTSHGRPVHGRATLLDDRFLVVAGAVLDGDLSGCGIDKSVHAVEAIAQSSGVQWLSPLLVFYRDAGGAVQAVSRGAFRTLVQQGAVTTATPVFDLGISELGALRQGAFERPAGQSWHARTFRIAQPA